MNEEIRSALQRVREYVTGHEQQGAYDLIDEKTFDDGRGAAQGELYASDLSALLDLLSPPVDPLKVVGLGQARQIIASQNDKIEKLRAEYDRLRLAEQAILALIERAERESLPAVAVEKLRRALDRPRLETP